MAEHGRIRPSTSQGYRLAELSPGGNAKSRMQVDEVPNQPSEAILNPRGAGLERLNGNVRRQNKC